ncbi:MAG: T9SS type A sorting domain-containing protein, partial [Candidatus Latescibacteria bacterium]|nr:T9SS type A sorting domain-containing protein [Candidatus Latescibacterota bacterium]
KAADGTFAIASEGNGAIAVDNTLLADFSSSLKVWTEDFAMFVNNFGMGEADVEFDPVFDLSGNGKVWTEDFTIFVGQFGKTAGAAKAIASAEGVNTGASAALGISREGAAITVDVSVEGLTELASYGLMVSFDSEALQFLGASEGNLLRSNALFATIPTKAGEVWMLNGQPEAVSTNDGLLSQLHFRALNDQAIGSAIRVDALDLFDRDASLNSVATQGLEVTVAPEKFALLQNYPNPGNPSTVISYTLAKNSKVNLTVYNTLGQVVRTLVDGHQTANIYQVVWDARNDSGREVASGVYFYRLVAGKFNATKRLIVLK